MARILDGKLVASAIKSDILAAVKESSLTIGLGTILVGDDAGSQKYVAGKHNDCAQSGIQSVRVDLAKTAPEEKILAEVEKLNEDPICTGYIVQLPLPKGVDEKKVLNAVSPEKDADGLHPFNLGLMLQSAEKSGPEPCTPSGIIELVNYFYRETKDEALNWNGKIVAVVGRGLTVGRPIEAMLTRKSVNATVIHCHTGTKNLEQLTKLADIVIVAVGQPHFLKPEHIKDGAVVIDVGVSRTTEGKVVGDIDPSVREKCSWYSPNPGGVGPMTRAMLLKNVFDIAVRAERGNE